MLPDITCVQLVRKGLALQIDLIDGGRVVLEPFVPLPNHVGRPRKWPMQRIVEAMPHLLRGGLACRMLPPGFTPESTVQR